MVAERVSSVAANRLPGGVGCGARISQTPAMAAWWNQVRDSEGERTRKGKTGRVARESGFVWIGTHVFQKKSRMYGVLNEVYL